jgi:hypothetical protein
MKPPASTMKSVPTLMVTAALVTAPPGPANWIVPPLKTWTEQKLTAPALMVTLVPLVTFKTQIGVLVGELVGLLVGVLVGVAAAGTQ